MSGVGQGRAVSGHRILVTSGVARLQREQLTPSTATASPSAAHSSWFVELDPFHGT
jgi:hypothetical protein